MTVSRSQTTFNDRESLSGGSRFPRHFHDHAYLSYVLEGPYSESYVKLGERQVSPGAVSVPRDFFARPHGAEALSAWRPLPRWTPG